jgi:outer membrane immunogenic protein
MNPLVRNLSIVGLGICAALPAAAQTGEQSYGGGQMYAELSYGWLKLDSDGFNVTSGELIGRFGYEFSKYLGAEVFAATNVSSGNLYGVDVKIDNAYGAYLKGRVQAAPNFELFGKLGWLHATLNASIPGVSASSSDSSFSYGVGMQYTFNEKWYAQADYMSYYDKSGDSIKGPSIGVGLRF